MGIGVSVFMIAVGAILAFAVSVTANGVNIETVGVILMIVGIVGLLWSALVIGLRRSPDRTMVVDEFDHDRLHEPETVIHRHY